MATILQESRYQQENQGEGNLYNSAEMITLVIGFMMMVMAFGGLFDPTFLGLSLTPMHGFILAGAGALAVWSGLFRDEKMKQAYFVNLGLGLFFLANAIAGLLLSVATKDRTLFNENSMNKIAPGFLELTALDHVMHGLVAIWFLLDAYLWQKRMHGELPQKTPFDNL